MHVQVVEPGIAFIVIVIMVGWLVGKTKLAANAESRMENWRRGRKGDELFKEQGGMKGEYG